MGAARAKSWAPPVSIAFVPPGAQDLFSDSVPMFKSAKVKVPNQDAAKFHAYGFDWWYAEIGIVTLSVARFVLNSRLQRLFRLSVAPTDRNW